MDVLGQFSRRNMLIGLGGAAAVGAVGAKAAVAAVVPPKPPATLGTANFEDWRTKLGTNFTASTGQVLRLVEVQAFARQGVTPPGVRVQGFLTRFDVVRGGAIAEGLYRVAHPTGGTFDIFLTKADRTLPLRMLAVFN